MTFKKPHCFNYPLFVVVAALLVLGILMLSGVSADISQERFGTTTYYLFHQIIFGLVAGTLLALIAYKIPLSFLKKWSWFFILVNLILMLLVFIPGLKTISGGAPRWLNLGFFTLQPSEFLKLTFIIYLSAFLAARTKKKEKKDWKLVLVPFIIVLLLIFVILYFQSDASTLFLIVAITGLIYFSSETPLWHILLLGLMSLVGMVFFIIEPYRMNRILVFLGLLRDPMKMGYQIKQALITVGSGGISGLGLGMSVQKVTGFLPQPMSDAIFAIFAEETGFIGSLILVSLFLLFLWQGFSIAKNTKDKFLKLMSLGITSWICLQAFINIGAMVGILPLTGIPLPFISYGASHLVSELIGVGILLNISKFAKK